MDEKSNNPPDVVLELTNEEATFLLRNCRVNIQYGLDAMQAMDLDPNTSDEFFAKMQEQLKHFTEMQNKLRMLGVTDAD